MPGVLGGSQGGGRVQCRKRVRSYTYHSATLHLLLLPPPLLLYRGTSLMKKTPTPLGPPYRDTSLTRKRTPLGTYRRTLPRVLGGSLGGPRRVGVFLKTRYPCTLGPDVDWSHDPPFRASSSSSIVRSSRKLRGIQGSMSRTWVPHS